MSYYAIDNRSPDLKHYGVLGMKWGVRRYENPDGTLTPAGKKRYGVRSKKAYKNGFHDVEGQSNRYNDYSRNVIDKYYADKGYKNTRQAYKAYKKQIGKNNDGWIKRHNDWVALNRDIADKQLKKDYMKEFGGLNEYNRDRLASKIAEDSFYLYRKNIRNNPITWGLIPATGLAIADSISLSKKHGPKGTNYTYEMLKADKQSRDYRPTGKYKRDTLDVATKSQHQINQDYKRIKERNYYNSLSKSQKLDYNYKKDHKQLSRFVNRDGSLTTQGKLKYWDSYAPRGEARMQKDIQRDKLRTQKRRSK